MKPYFIYALELDAAMIGINLLQVITINKGSVKTTGEEVTMVKMVGGKEVVVRLSFEAFQEAVKEAMR